MNVWRCDICGKLTNMNPEMEPVIVPNGTRKVHVVGKDGLPSYAKNEEGKPDYTKPIYKEEPIYKQETTKIRRQNLSQGAIVETVEVPKFKIKNEDKAGVLVRIKIGQENVQADFCKPCFDEALKPKLKPVFDEIMDIAEEAGSEGR